MRAQEGVQGSRRLDTHTQAILDGLAEGVVVLDERGEVLFVSSRVRELYDVFPSADEATVLAEMESHSLFRPFGDEVMPRDRPLHRAARGEEFSDLRYEVRRASEESRTHVFTCRRVRNGEVLFILTIRDLTVLTLAEAAQADAQARFERAFRLAPVPAVMVSGASGRVLDANSAFEKQLELPLDRCVGRTLEALRLWATADEASKAVEALQAGSYRNLELRLSTGGGRELTVLGFAETIPLDHETVTLHMFSDITSQKRSEQHLRRAIQEVMSDTSWFAQSIMERLAGMRDGAGPSGSVQELTERERQVLAQLSNGRSNGEIAADLGIAAQTVRNYISSIYGKIGVHSRAEAVVWGRERGLNGSAL